MRAALSAVRISSLSSIQLAYNQFDTRSQPEIPCVSVFPVTEGTYPKRNLIKNRAGTCAPAPAIANAIYNAIGVRIREIPITPQRILKALGKA